MARPASDCFARVVSVAAVAAVVAIGAAVTAQQPPPLAGAGAVPPTAQNGRPPVAQATATPVLPEVAADVAQPRVDQNSMLAHAQLLQKTRLGKIDVYFEGDSIVRRWGATDYPLLLANWKANFWGWNAADFGWGGDRTQNILWRLQQGELDGINPKVIVLLAGTNNVGTAPPSDAKADEVARGVKAIVDLCLEKAPAATLVLTAIFPRNDNIALMSGIARINESLSRLADGRRVRFLNINDRLADQTGRLFPEMFNPDRLHPTVKAYQIWADALKPIFVERLGPPAATDGAPPPTGDPSAAPR
ncbi:MAG: GDSL-type esterase/lipase family protein [Vicinamibacterales bacterium]